MATSLRIFHKVMDTHPTKSFVFTNYGQLGQRLCLEETLEIGQQIPLQTPEIGQLYPWQTHEIKWQNSRQTPKIGRLFPWQTQEIGKLYLWQTQELGQLIITEQIDDSVVVACEESDEISEEQHEGAVDHAVVQVGGSHLEVLNLNKKIKFYASIRTTLSEQNWLKL